MDNPTIEKMARALAQAQKDVTACPLPQSDDLDIDAALAIQAINVPTVRKGYKIALTTEASRANKNATEPTWGYVGATHCHTNGAELTFSGFLSPRVECELALVLGRDVTRPLADITQAAQAVEYVLPCFEVTDSRYGRYDTSLCAMVADNAFFGAVILGDTPVPLVDPSQLDNVGMRLEKNGRDVASSSSAAVMGNPLNALVWLSHKLCAKGGLHAGEIILSGAFAPATEAAVGDYFRAAFYGMGSVSLRFA